MIKPDKTIETLLLAFKEDKISFDTTLHSILMLIKGLKESRTKQKYPGSDGGYSKPRQESGEWQGFYAQSKQ